MQEILSPRRVQRVRREPRRRDVTVARVERLGANFASVVFAADSLRDFESLSFDDHVKFIFDSAGGETERRDYTPRRFDAARGELTIEFVLHGHGAAAQWARQAAPGQRAAIGGPRGSMIVPTDYEWHLLAGDASALPAINRRIEELPAGTRAIVVAQVEDAADERRFESAAALLDVCWVRTPEDFLATMSALRLPGGEGYAWCAGEASVMARLRQVLLVDKQLPRECARIAAYWKQGTSSHHENLE